MHPLAISTMLTTELSLTLGILTLSSEESLRATSLPPERANLTASGALSMQLGPRRLAEEVIDSTHHPMLGCIFDRACDNEVEGTFTFRGRNFIAGLL